jgi:hypothetical protein
MKTRLRIEKPVNFKDVVPTKVVYGDIYGIVIGTDDSGRPRDYVLIMLDKPLEWDGNVIDDVVIAPKNRDENVNLIFRGELVEVIISSVRRGVRLQVGKPFGKEDTEYFFIGATRLVKKITCERSNPIETKIYQRMIEGLNKRDEDILREAAVVGIETFLEGKIRLPFLSFAAEAFLDHRCVDEKNQNFEFRDEVLGHVYSKLGVLEDMELDEAKRVAKELLSKLEKHDSDGEFLKKDSSNKGSMGTIS